MLAQSRFVDAIRRFRNATFHYQGEIVSPKVEEFLAAEASEDWAYELYGAMKTFFEKQIGMNDVLDRLPERG